MFEFYSIHFYSGSFDTILSAVSRWIKQKKSAYICVVSVHGVVEAYKNRSFLSVLQKADLAVPDGMPLVWIGKIFGHVKTTRIYGPDLLLHMCKEAEKKRFRVFFYGTTSRTLHLLITRVKKLYPHLIIAGSFAPSFRPATPWEIQQEKIIIQTSKPDILFVGLSTPKQEFWMDKNYSLFVGTTCIGVGAAFDFIAGTKKQAPEWIRSIGFEWLFRFFQEPTRLWKRYCLNVILFPYLLLKNVVYSLKRT